MQNPKDAAAFYDQRYKNIGTWILSPEKKVRLKNKNGNQRCRFCGECSPKVTFKLDAHAIPESLGNKSLLSDYECDVCNNCFGEGIENDFGNWSKPMRTFARIRGKSGVPTLKKEGAKAWRIEYDNTTGFNIKLFEDNPEFLVIDEATNQVTFKFQRDVYTPVAVLKAFVKMGLSLMPESEVHNFSTAIKWITTADHNKGLVAETAFPIICTFIPGPMPNDKIVLFLYLRRDGIEDMPYAFFILAYGNEAFQVFLPSPERDLSIHGKEITFIPYPTPFDINPSQFGRPQRSLLDLTGRNQVKGDVFELTLHFEARKKTASQS